MGDQTVAVTCMCQCDGRLHVLQLRLSDRVGTLRARLAAVVGLPAEAPPLQLVCNGTHCVDDGAQLSALPCRAFTAWVPRYSRHVSDAAKVHAAKRAADKRYYEENKLQVEARALIADARHRLSAALSAVRRHAPLVRSALGRVERRTWGTLALWGGLTLFARELGFAMPFLILAAIYGIFSNLGSNQGGASAYTVFNGMQALPGQLHADDVQRDMLRGIGM